MIRMNQFGDSAKLQREIARLEQLVVDMKAIAAGTGPSPAELDNAPYVVEPTFSYRAAASLLGATLGHPLLGNTEVLTSEIWVISLEQGWARTRSRYYRFDAGTKLV